MFRPLHANARRAIKSMFCFAQTNAIPCAAGLMVAIAALYGFIPMD